jgi:formylglycine-generating enzyme
MAFRFVLLALMISMAGGCALLKRGAGDGLMPLKMVAIPAGAFAMGDVFEASDEDATPVHGVAVEAFRIAAFETTIGAYRAYASRTGIEVAAQPGPAVDSQAVTNVTWFEAQAFCNAYGFRLPSEAEWEYAARAGGLTQRYAGTSDVDSVGLYTRHSGNSAAHPFLVGSKRPNDLGLYDMSGNVYEWVGAFYTTYHADSDSLEYVDLDTRQIRIIRGGSFRASRSHSQTFRRAGTLADIRSDQIGFRCAVDS